MKYCVRKLLLLFACLSILLFCAKTTSAEGTYYNIGVPPGSTGSSDAVSWANAFPIMIDNFGNYIVLTQQHSTGTYFFNASNDKGSTWQPIQLSGLTLRPTTVYDSQNDKIHMLQETATTVTYRRFIINRNSDNSVNSIYQDPAVSPLTLDNLTGCTGTFGTYPVLLWKDDGADGILVAFWETIKTCSGTTLSQNRASMINLANSSADGNAANWTGLNGTDDGGSGAAVVDYNILYSYTGSPTSGRGFLGSAVIRGGSGTRSEDIYFFNIDENLTHGFRRLGWDGVDGNWSNTWTARQTFGGAINNASGYSNKDELMTKPVYDPVDDRVYVGIARYISAGGLGDTQSIFYVDGTDTVSAGVNVYSALGDAWFAPTLDISYNDVDDNVYVFYQTSDVDPTNSSNTNVSFEGDAYYRTVDGATQGTPQPFMTQPLDGVDYSVDIPIVYQGTDNNRLILFFRADGPETPFVPPHYIFFGYIPSGATVTSTPSPSPASGGTFTATSYDDFRQLCSVQDDTNPARTITPAIGEVTLKNTFRDDFEPPLGQASSQISYNKWVPGDYDGAPGTFYSPTMDGEVVLNNANGANMRSVSTFTTGGGTQILEFRGEFTSDSFQHIGFIDSTDFNTFAMFSTMNNDGQLYARTTGGGGNVAIGAFMDAVHTYRIEWTATTVTFYVDGVQEDQRTESIAGPLYVILSNNTNTAGSLLAVEWLQMNNYSSTSGTYQSCSLNSGSTSTIWGISTFNAILNSGTATVQTRTSNDNSTWSSWTSLTSGAAVGSTGQFLQYLITLGGTSTSSPDFTDITFNFGTPTPSPTLTPTLTPTNTPTATPTNTPTPTLTPTLTLTPTATLTPTVTPTPSDSPTPTPTGSVAAATSVPNTPGPTTPTVVPANVPHIFITRIGTQSVFISSQDGSTIPTSPVVTGDRFLTLQGITKANSEVTVVMDPQGNERTVSVNDDSKFTWTANKELDLGTYKIFVTENDGGSKRTMSFQVTIASVTAAPSQSFSSGSGSSSTGTIGPVINDAGEESEELDLSGTPILEEDQVSTEEAAALEALQEQEEQNAIGKTIKLLILDQQKAPMPNANVTVNGKEYTTDGEGILLLEDPEVGSYTVKGSGPDGGIEGVFALSEEEIDTVSEVSIELKKPSPNYLLYIAIGIVALSILSFIIFKMRK